MIITGIIRIHITVGATPITSNIPITGFQPLFSIDEIATCGEVIAATLLGLTPKIEEK